jgi:hypothetical protein
MTLIGDIYQGDKRGIGSLLISKKLGIQFSESGVENL